LLTFGALSNAFAIFFILEFGMPYTGMFKVTPAALVQIIEFIERESVLKRGKLRTDVGLDEFRVLPQSPTPPPGDV
jgi:hypothetical protein